MPLTAELGDEQTRKSKGSDVRDFADITKVLAKKQQADFYAFAEFANTTEGVKQHSRSEIRVLAVGIKATEQIPQPCGSIWMIDIFT